MNVVILSGVWDKVPMRYLGPYVLKHCLKKRGYTCQVIDYCQYYTADELVNTIEQFVNDSTVCLAMSSTFWSRLSALKTFTHARGTNNMPADLYSAVQTIKQRYPGLKITVGGPNVRNANDIEFLDCIITGEAEDLFPELVDYWLGRGPEPQRQTIDGVDYYGQCITKTYDISLCDFAWDDNDCIVEGETLPMETARGCIFSCKFCAYPHLGKKKFDYLRSNDYIRQHLQDNYNKFGVSNYYIVDDTFNDSEYKIDSFVEITKGLPFKIGYVCYTRADLLWSFEGMAEKMLASGLKGTFIGLESLHPRTSQIVGKGWSGRHAKTYIPNLVHDLWQDSVKVQLGLIVGLPHEDQTSLEHTRQWANDHDLNAIYIPLSLTKDVQDRDYTSVFEKNAEKYGYRFNDSGEWENDIITNRQSVKVALRMNNNKTNNTVSSWYHMGMLGMGYTHEELLTMDWKHLDSLEFQQREQEFVSKYKNKVKSLV
jgi:radical SAM superfamily enzyme YgiQ (UPF0313 family)